MKNVFQYGVVSAEISYDFQRVAQVARELGIDYIDINVVDRQQVTDLPDDAVDGIAETLKSHNLRAMMITGPTFKNISVDGYTPEAFIRSEAFLADMHGLRRGFAVAKRLQTPYVRVFSFARSGPGPIPENCLAVVRKALQTAAAEAKDHGITLLLENVRGCWANTGQNSAEILRAVDADNLKMVWDPANAFVAGETSNELLMEGMKAVTPYIEHFHIKDARIDGNRTGGVRINDNDGRDRDQARDDDRKHIGDQDRGHDRGPTGVEQSPAGRQTGTDSQGNTISFDWVCIGDGDVEIKGQLEALLATEYNGPVTLETHWKPAGGTAEEGSRASFARLVDIVASVEAKPLA